MRRRLQEIAWRFRQWAGRPAPLRVAGNRAALAPLVDLQAGLARVASGLQFTEGPVWNPEARVLLFTDIPASRIYQLDGEGRLSVKHEPTHHANGLTLDRQGRLIACEHGGRQVTRRHDDGSVTVLAARFGGRRLNSPNDVVVARDGAVWFTDPPYGIHSGEQELPFQGVFRWQEGAGLQVALEDFDRPNGLAFSPDESCLYVADSSRRRHIRVFPVGRDGVSGPGRVFVSMDGPAPGVPDGLKVDREGNVYSTGPGGIWVLDPAGRHLGTILIPEPAANCAWGDEDWCSLYVTAKRSVYRLRVRVPGHPLGRDPA